MKLTLILATVVIGLATVGCRQEPPAATGGAGAGDKLTHKEGKTSNGPDNGPSKPATQ